MLEDGPLNPVTRHTDSFQRRVSADGDGDAEYRNANVFNIETVEYEFVERDDDERLVYDVELAFSRTAFGDELLDGVLSKQCYVSEVLDDVDDLQVNADAEVCERLVGDLIRPPVSVQKGELLEIDETGADLLESASGTVTARVACEGFDRDWSNGGCRLRFGSGSTDWSLETTLTEATIHVLSVDFSPDGDYIAYGSTDDNVYIHEVGGSWNEIAESPLTEATNNTFSVKFSPGGEYIAYASQDDNVYIHEVGNGWNEISESPLTEAGGNVRFVTFSPGGEYIAYGGADDNVYIHEVGGGWSLEETLTEANNSVRSGDFSQDGEYIAYGSNDSNVYIHEVGGTWGEIPESPLTEAGDSSRSVKFSTEASHIAYGSDDDNVYIHEVGGSWNEIAESPLTEAGGVIEDIDWLMGDWVIAYASHDGNLYIHEVGASWALEQTLTEANDWVMAVDFSPDQSWIAYGSNDDNLYIHNTTDFPQSFESIATATVGPIVAVGTTARGKTSTATSHVAPITDQGVRGPQTRATSGTTYTGPIVASGEREASADGVGPKEILVDGELRAQLLQGQPSPKRGETTTIRLRTEDPGSSGKYKRLRQYLEYAGEADYGTLLGGAPFVREHPLDAWPVESHVVSIEPGSEIYDWDGVWGLLVDGSDDSVITGESGNPYVVDLEVVVLARLREYDTRAALLADLSPTLNQL